MTETEKDVEPFDRHNPRSGITCPWNRDDQGPAGRRIHCLIYKNHEDFSNEAAGYGDPPFCAKHCQHGRNPQARRRSQEIRDRFRGQMPAWFKATVNPPEFMFPVRGRKVR